MFAKACAITRHFTRPVVVSSQRVDGQCGAGIGSFVVINPEGWAVSAWHILEEAQRQAKHAGAYQKSESDRAAIYADPTLNKHTRSTNLRALPKFSDDSVARTSAWWSWDPVRVEEIAAVPMVDLVIFRLQNFDPAWVNTYPTFKDPSKNFDPGTSLCRIGFPFHEITPVFQPATNNFQLPAGSLPLPIFPNEGIFTRVVEVIPPSPPPFPLQLIETSSPGLKGQSGGPIFDVQGSIWGIQSKTRHYPLGFSPPVPGGKPHEKEHQFLNVGWGIHTETIVKALSARGIAFRLSDY